MSAIPFAMAGILCPLIVLVVFIAVVIRVIRIATRSGASSVAGGSFQRPAVTTELGADGFWILPSPLPPVSVIFYHYWSGGTRHTAQVPYQPGPDGRQFVYTGLSRNDSIERGFFRRMGGLCLQGAN